MTFVGTLIINTIAFLIIARLLPGFEIKRPATAAMMALIYGIITVIGSYFLVAALVVVLLPIVALIPFLALPAIAVGYLASFLVGFVLSVAVLMVTDSVLDDFFMDGPATAVIAAVMLSVISTVFRAILY